MVRTDAGFSYSSAHVVWALALFYLRFHNIWPRRRPPCLDMTSAMRLREGSLLQAVGNGDLIPVMVFRMSILRVRLTMQRCWRRFNQTYQGIQITLAYNISVSSSVLQGPLRLLMQHLTRILFYLFLILQAVLNAFPSSLHRCTWCAISALAIQRRALGGSQASW